jgi:hypothetical protein
MTNNIHELAEQLGTTVDDLKKTVYKYTECGAWIHHENGKIELGSIVEGSDAEVGPYTLNFPFEMKSFWDTLQKIEDEADMLWKEANEGDD